MISLEKKNSQFYYYLGHLLGLIYDESFQRYLEKQGCDVIALKKALIDAGEAAYLVDNLNAIWCSPDARDARKMRVIYGQDPDNMKIFEELDRLCDRKDL